MNALVIMWVGMDGPISVGVGVVMAPAAPIADHRPTSVRHAHGQEQPRCEVTARRVDPFEPLRDNSEGDPDRSDEHRGSDVTESTERRYAKGAP